DDEAEDDAHGHALDLEGSPEGGEAVAPVADDGADAGGLADRNQQIADPIGLVDLEFDDVPDAFLGEEQLVLLQRHEDEGAVEVGGAGTEQAADAIGLLQPAEIAQGGVGAGRGIAGGRVADAQAHAFGQRLADQDVLTAVGALAEGAAGLVAEAVVDVLHRAEILRADAADHGAGGDAGGADDALALGQGGDAGHAGDLGDAPDGGVAVRR